jgi:hypothetical protein
MTEEYGNIADGFLLSQSEIDELRNKKFQLTEYAKEKLRKLIYERDMKKMEDATENLVLNNLTHEEMLEIAAEREALSANVEIPQNTEKPFYRFFAIDYVATGEGRSYWLKICRNYQAIDDKDRDLEKFAKFVGEGADYYMHGLEQPTEDEFLEKYGKLVPDYIIEMIARRDQPFFIWETHLHFNYS